MKLNTNLKDLLQEVVEEVLAQGVRAKKLKGQAMEEEVVEQWNLGDRGVKRRRPRFEAAVVVLTLRWEFSGREEKIVL